MDKIVTGLINKLIILIVRPETSESVNASFLCLSSGNDGGYKTKKGCTFREITINKKIPLRLKLWSVSTNLSDEAVKPVWWDSRRHAATLQTDRGFTTTGLCVKRLWRHVENVNTHSLKNDGRLSVSSPVFPFQELIRCYADSTRAVILLLFV